MMLLVKESKVLCVSVTMRVVLYILVMMRVKCCMYW